MTGSDCVDVDIVRSVVEPPFVGAVRHETFIVYIDLPKTQPA